MPVLADYDRAVPLKEKAFKVSASRTTFLESSAHGISAYGSLRWREKAAYHLESAPCLPEGVLLDGRPYDHIRLPYLLGASGYL